ncbi:MAG TPA: hypothetical protein VIL66_09450 [Bacillota bacterium]
MTRIHFLLLLDRLEELITNRPRIAGRSLVVVDDVLELLDKIRMALPPEVKRADEILTEREEFLKNSRKEADQIIKAAQEEAKKLVAEHVILQKAQEEARAIKKEADDYSRQVKKELSQYIHRISERLEENLTLAVKIIKSIDEEFKES